MHRVSPLFALALAAATPRALAQEGDPVGWGRRTTSDVEGQVEAPEPEPIADGVYGRFEGDLELGLGGGVELDERGSRGALRLTLHYFSMIGMTSSYAEQVGGGGSERLLTIGVDLRPAFIPRWSKDMEQGPGLVDLAIDSISLGLAAFWAEPEAADFGDQRGLELSGGFGIPLFGRASGPWLEARALGRFAEETPSTSGRGEAALLLLFAWHAFVETPLAD